LTVVGIALGVATVRGVTDLSHSVLTSFREMMDALAGEATLEITAPGGTVDETDVAIARSRPGVRGAAGIVEAFIPLRDHPDQSVYLIGTDFLGDRVGEAQFPRSALEVPDEVAFPNHLDSAIVTLRLSSRLALSLDSPLSVVAPKGVRTLIVRGFLHDVPATRLFDGAVIVMDLPAAQELLGRPNRVDRIAVALKEGASANDVRADLAQALGEGVDAPHRKREVNSRSTFSSRCAPCCS
jgi:ABC-type lipoprotein release transport system permease subunit